ncbi:MAG: C4-dicarboxylate ABC transporter permease [Firmicutes bacterium]|jgi:putative tricarboxylic transport membrane protein|nr:C4-dicarboxylate ABC transporter permease [Bacillota bacterium]
MLTQAAIALGNIFAWPNFGFLTLGTLVGIVVGCLPGLTATMALALLVPFTFTMPAMQGLIMLGGLYIGAMYGGAISATLINTPGTPSAIATTFDGFPLAKKGMAQHSLVAAAYSSMIGGLFGTVLLLFLSPPLARMALQFGPAEYFWMAVFGLTIIATLSTESILKGLIGGALGLLLSTVGISPIAGDVRFTFGIPSLQGGIDLIVALIGFFSLPQVLEMVEEYHVNKHIGAFSPKPGITLEVVKELTRKPGLLLRSSLVGTIVGIIPGAGGNIASLLSYNEAVRWSSRPEEFGQGTIDGVAAAEAANNAVVPGALTPLLTLGIPGSPAAAVFLGTLLLHGLRPGPELFTEFGEITYALIFSLAVSSVVMFVMGVCGSQWFARMINFPISFLAPMVTFLSVIGSYAIRNNYLDVVAMLGFGFLGYVSRKLGFHPGPIVLGLILGPMAEQGLVQGMIIGRASGSIIQYFFCRPLSAVFILLSFISALWPFLAKSYRRQMKRG